MLPYCSSEDPIWMCMRGFLLGSVSLCTLIFCLYAAYRMLPVSITHIQHRASIGLILLAAIEMLLLFLRCLLMHEPKLMIGAKYCRGVQIAVSCWLYGRLACDITSARSIMYGLLIPLLAGISILMTADVIVMLQDPVIDCHHSSWLVMSTASAVLAG